MIRNRNGPFGDCHNVVSATELAAVETDCIENACEANHIDGACVMLQVSCLAYTSTNT